MRFLDLGCLSLIMMPGFVNGFLIRPRSAKRFSVFSGNAEPKAAAVPTLTGQPWRVVFRIRVPSKNGQGTPRTMAFDAQFQLEEGYEPPQGRMIPVDRDQNRQEMEKFVDIQAPNRWKLSEDPNDRKDGLWIWGLFEEPLYPFCLLQLSFNEVQLSPDSDKPETLPAFTLYAQVTHICDRKTGQVELKPAEVSIRSVETVVADLAGLATADITTDEPVGTVRFTPIMPNM